MGRILQIFEILLLLLGFARPAFAIERILQILHTNDIHSYWEYSEHRNFGGVAKLKTKMNELESQGTAQGWVTIKLDAGDFCDGNVNYYSQAGARAFQMEKALGFDVVALGNHDYLTGADDLVIHSRKLAEKIHLAAANFNLPRDTGVEPGYLINRGGLRIAVAGATTKNSAFNWAVWPAQITRPLIPVEKWLTSQNADIRIALTHIGFNEDRALARNSSKIDIIVGGHSHLALPQPALVKNKLGRNVPIVQAGSHAVFLGQMVVKISDVGPPQILSYKLHRIDGKIDEAPEIKKLVDETRNDLNHIFQSDLDKIVAHSSQDFSTHYEPAPIIGNLFADAMREAAGTEIAIDSGQFYTDLLEAGPVSIRDIYNLAPHVYSWSSGGWHIYKCTTRSLALRAALSLLGSSRLSLGVSGMDLKLGPLDLVTSIKIHGKPMEIERPYTLALSEGFAFAVFTRPRIENLLCSELKDTGLLVRDALLKKIEKMQILSPETLGPKRIHRLEGIGLVN